MKRNHIHFAVGLSTEGGVVSGIRQSAEVFIYLNVHKAMQGAITALKFMKVIHSQSLADGMVLFRSQNNVILTQGFQGLIPPAYFSRVTDTKGQSLFPS
jgi:2'-phosphotransferase